MRNTGVLTGAVIGIALIASQLHGPDVETDALYTGQTHRPATEPGQLGLGATASRQISAEVLDTDGDGIHMRVRLRGLRLPQLQAATIPGLGATAIGADLYVSAWRVPGDNAVLLSAQLVSLADGMILWSRSFLSESDDLDQLQAEIRRLVGEAVAISIQAGVNLPTV